MAKRRDDDEPARKRVEFLQGEIKTSPFSKEARGEAGRLIRRLQNGKMLGMPKAEPLPIVGPRCGAIRVRDAQHNWRIMFRIDPTVILVVDIYDKKTRRIPDDVINRCKNRLKRYDETGEN